MPARAEELEVRVGTNATATAATAGPQIFNNTNITSTSATGSSLFIPSTTGIYYFGFHAYSAANTYALYVDDIKVEVAPACPIPTTINISNITTTSASIGFTAAGPDVIIEYGSTGFTPGIGATAGTGGTIVSGTGSPAMLSGLTVATTYDVYVRQNCTTSGTGTVTIL